MRKKMETRKKVILTAAAIALAAGAVTGVNSMEAQAAAKTVKINKTNFPDVVFRELVKANYDKNHDNKLSASEIKKAKNFGNRGKTQVKIKPSKYAEYQKKYITDIKSFKGIEKLTNLRVLVAEDTSVKKINLKKNKKLTTLNLTGGKITSLDLNQNKDLKYVYLSYNPLKTLKINKCKKLLRVELQGHMIKNLKINRNKKTKVIGGKYYSPYEATRVPLTIQGNTQKVSLDINGNYCIYNWSEDNSSCVKYTWNGTKMEESRIVLGEAAMNKAKAMHSITGQWQDAGGNFYFLADQTGDLSGESIIYVCKVNPQGVLEQETLLKDQIQAANNQYKVEYLNQKDNTVLLKLSYGSMYEGIEYAVLTFDTGDMSVKQQANMAWEVVAAEGDVVVGQNASQVLVHRLTGGKDVTLDNGYQLKVVNLSSSHYLYVPLGDNYRCSVTVRNGFIYAISGSGMYKASLSASEFKQIHGVGKMDGLRDKGISQNSLVVKSDKEICLLRTTYDGNDEGASYVNELQIGTIQ